MPLSSWDTGDQKFNEWKSQNSILSLLRAFSLSETKTNLKNELQSAASLILTFSLPFLPHYQNHLNAPDTSGENDEYKDDDHHENLPWTNVPSTHPTRFETGEPFRSVASAYFSNLWKRHRCALNILVEYQYRPHVQP